MKLSVMPEVFSICQFSSGDPVPAWAMEGKFFSISRSEEELSVLCESRLVPEGIESESGWGAIRVEGQLDFSLTGILASMADPLAKAGVSIFAVSTYRTDYVLVKQLDLRRAKEVLGKAGFDFV